ncbi:hypothetical protein [Micromonospora zingiberis]|nr:hypothetical protein [Micromonospora zingiberis]
MLSSVHPPGGAPDRTGLARRRNLLTAGLVGGPLYVLVSLI